ncbi:cell division protein FtsL [Primorskyibacter sp. 2E107]|uniref:cell division protein FtsL n=1 Tax=Primorskyibacter sp. 2E107 TaxID=3403458 RepID=UPI003AF4DF1C
MRTLLFLLTAMAVIGSGFWAYRENYATQAELDRVQALQQEIGAARERLAILRAEWAYLNRPDRLRDLADLNFARLGLLPLRADQFGRVDQVAFPMPEKIDISEPIDVTSAGADE